MQIFNQYASIPNADWGFHYDRSKASNRLPKVDGINTQQVSELLDWRESKYLPPTPVHLFNNSRRYCRLNVFHKHKMRGGFEQVVGGDEAAPCIAMNHWEFQQ